jgi:hypothetical protein
VWVAVLVFVLAIPVAYRVSAATDPSEPDCRDTIAIDVAAAPEIAPAVAAIAQRWSAARTACATAAVRSLAPSTVADSIRANNSTPDVWVADSSARLRLLEQDGVESVAGQPLSIAQSPLLLALSSVTADTLSWPTALSSWQEVIEAASSQKIHIGIAPPDRDIASRLWLSGFVQAVGDLTSAEVRRDLVTAMLTMDANRVRTDADLLAHLTRDSALAAVPLPEHAIISLNADASVPLVVAQLNPSPLALDYPYVILSQQPAARGAAEQLRDELTGDHFRQHLATAGLRGPDGMVVPGLAIVPGAPTRLPEPAPPQSTELANAFEIWSTVTRPGRILAVVDASGSMAESAPGTGKSRERIAVEAGETGLGRLSDDWAVGLWKFSTELDGSVDHEVLLPIEPLTDEHRDDLHVELGTLDPQGGTGLYDTVVAAYLSFRKINGVFPAICGHAVR